MISDPDPDKPENITQSLSRGALAHKADIFADSINLFCPRFFPERPFAV
jgi:hypothetical protein